MESISSIINTNTLCTHVVTKSALKKENTECNNTWCTLSKREYGLLLRQLEMWGTKYPKSICRIYGTDNVKRAIDYTLATPNVRNKGGYFMYMLRQFKKQEPQHTEQKISHVKQVLDTNIPNEHKIEYKGTQLPQIENWQDARKFLCDFYDGAYEKTDNVISFVKDIKRRYNFG